MMMHLVKILKTKLKLQVKYYKIFLYSLNLILDLPPYTIEDLSIHLSKLSNKYLYSMLEEVEYQTKIVDPKTTIKNPVKCKEVSL